MSIPGQRWKFPIFVVLLQVAFILVFAFVGEYNDSARPKDTNKDGTNVEDYYPMFMDIHGMIFVGFGFLMTFLKRYSYGAVSINLLIAAMVIQWATIIRGLIHNDVTNGVKFPLVVTEMMTADFASATVLISFGAVLGKTTPMQLLIMALIETVLAQVNEWIGLDFFSAQDPGESMYIHAFGAYFGLAVALVLYNKEVEESTQEGAVYHSDVFSMIGTVFLWIFWPSFNGGGVLGDERHRAVLNTYYSLCASTLITFALSALTSKDGKFNMVHIQNATLAGGVAVGTTAHMDLTPWGALLMGSVAGAISVLGFRFLSPCLTKYIKLHDTCGVHNLHGMPGILAGVAGAVVAALATYERYGESQSEVFPAMMNSTDHTTDPSAHPHLLHPYDRTPHMQGGYQMAALGTTLAMAIAGGVFTGLILKIPIWDQPERDEIFNDTTLFEVAEEGFPELHPGKKYPDHDLDTRMTLEMMERPSRDPRGYPSRHHPHPASVLPYDEYVAVEYPPPGYPRPGYGYARASYPPPHSVHPQEFEGQPGPYYMYRGGPSYPEPPRGQWVFAPHRVTANGGKFAFSREYP